MARTKHNLDNPMLPCLEILIQDSELDSAMADQIHSPLLESGPPKVLARTPPRHHLGRERDSQHFVSTGANARTNRTSGKDQFVSEQRVIKHIVRRDSRFHQTFVARKTVTVEVSRTRANLALVSMETPA